MNGRIYWKNQLPAVVFQLLCMLFLDLFLLAVGNSPDSVLLISLVWTLVAAAWMAAAYRRRKKEMNGLLHMQEQLKERYLLPELMAVPGRADDRVFLDLMRAAEKSMLERIGEVGRERTAYKEYIEQWLHEVKTPITAARLLCENNAHPFTRELLTELEKINRYTEQALYYARSGYTQKDYVIREISLKEVVHSAIADNRYLLRQNNVAVEAADCEATICSDDKWVRFILNQLIVNAVKYGGAQPRIRIYADRDGERVRLCVEDNGIGIPADDLPRVFDKGFTGKNGRIRPDATGIGLYLCKRLCGRLDIGLGISSGSGGTTVVLSFQINDFVRQVQG